MGGAPLIVPLAPNIAFEPGAAASFLRFVTHLGRVPDVNRTTTDYWTQLGMYRAWEAWASGKGPKPNHSRAVHPDKSVHVEGRAWDTDEWSRPGFLEDAAEYGWIQTAADDPTERHHLEYQWWRDQRRLDPTPRNLAEALITPTEDTMGNPVVNVVPNYGDKPENGTIWIGVSDGTFEKYDPPYDINVREAIAAALMPGRKEIPSISARDFQTLQRFWKTMQKRR